MIESFYKISGYSYAEDALNRVWSALNILGKLPKTDALAQQLSASLETVYRNLRQSKDTPRDQLMGGVYKSDLNNAIIAANKALENPKLQQLLQSAQGAVPGAYGELGHFYYENDPLSLNNITLVPSSDPSQPGEIQIQGLKLNESKASKSVLSGMNGWMRYDTKTQTSWIRGTQEAWKLFLSLSHNLFRDQEFLEQKKFRPPLPSEKNFAPDFQQQKNDAGTKFLEAYLLNAPDENALFTWDVGNKKQERLQNQGVRLQLEQGDKQFWMIRDLLAKTAGFTRFRVSASENLFDVYDTNPTGWYAVSKKLQYWGYDVKKLNSLLPALTGKSIGKVQQEKGKKEKSQGLGGQTIANAIKSNIFTDATGQMRPTIASRFGLGDVPIDFEQFSSVLKQNYPGAFGSTIPQSQQLAQQKGIFFAATRSASVLADEAGSGKTAQAIVAADIVREQNQKVLVFTPNILVKENWNGPKAKGPMLYAGHAKESVVVVKSAQDLSGAIASPDVIWVVVPLTAFKQDSGMMLGAAISQAANSGVFASLIFDEIQTIKNQDSKTYRAAMRALTEYGTTPDGRPYGIKHRMGLTGTPSDNDPTDIYLEMELLRHPLLYENKGILPDGRRDAVRRFNSEGFTSQFLGGQFIKQPKLSAEQRRTLSPEKQDEYLSRNTFFEATSLINWAKKLTDPQKLQILEFFAETFLRRSKSDIRHDIPPKSVVANPLEAPPGLTVPRSQQAWHITELMQMAQAKVPHTVAKALQYLSNPQQKLFIVTKHPEVAENIVNALNQKLGNFVAAFVAGDTGDNDREIIPDVFRENGGMLPQGQVPLRAIVYTMQLGAVGLNFAVADKAIFNDMDWNPSDNLQAEYRVHRINSQNPVTIDYFYFQGTYDEEMFKRVGRKQRVNEGVSDIMRRANMAHTPEEKLVVANEFVMSLVDSLLFELNLSQPQIQQIEKMKNQTGTLQPAMASNWYRQMIFASLDLVI